VEVDGDLEVLEVPEAVGTLSEGLGSTEDLPVKLWVR
jgi:hypothetical protein